MRRVLTHLKSGWQTTPFIHGAKRFLEDPDCPTLVVLQQQVEEQKVCGPRNAARDVFVLVYILRYVYYCTYITLRFVNFRKEKYVLLFVNFR